MMRVSQGFDLHSRERVLSATNDEGTNPEFWQEFHGTAVWKRFTHVYGATQANLDRIVGILNTMYPDQEFYTLDQVTDVFTTAFDSGGRLSDPLDRLPVEVVEPIPEPTPAPTDRNGRPLTASQLAWSEMTTFANEKSMREINERKRVDPKFLAFIQTNLRRDLIQEIDGDVRSSNPHIGEQPDVKDSAVKAIAAKAGLLVPQLLDWVKVYNSTPSSQVRSLRSAASNPLGYEQYEKSFQAALESHLI
jgi:hypothetical protein